MTRRRAPAPDPARWRPRHARRRTPGRDSQRVTDNHRVDAYRVLVIAPLCPPDTVTAVPAVPVPPVRHRPVLALLLTAAIAVAGVAQLAVQLGVQLPPPVGLLFADGSIGYDALFLDGRWWRPWTSQLVHGGPLHLLPNLAVIAVMAWRVERELGTGALWVVTASSVAAGALGIAWLEDLPAIGSSVLAFGLWGAVLASALRVQDAPDRRRRALRYALATVPLLGGLFAASLLAPGTTHVGHLCGLLGGAGAALGVPAAEPAPSPLRRRGVARDLAVGLLLALAPGLVGATVGGIPSLAGGRRIAVAVDGTPASLSLPARMARHPTAFAGLPAWRTSVASSGLVFAGLAGRSAVAPAGIDEAEGRLVADEPDSRWPGWTDRAWRLVDPATGRTIDRIEEHLRPTAAGTLHVGWRLGEAGSDHRRDLFRSVFDPLRPWSEDGTEPRRSAAEAW
ncbi:MAG: rhomboid family intramembrane serine protease [Deltaproteobacteria bacterium]|nr:MAG: rhomboid family intramembrane serine protease [Deltaproteobacteria bacterium]